MAKWTVTPGTVNNTMSGYIDYNDEGFHQEIVQDISAHVADVARAKEELESGGRKINSGGYRRMCTIPDVVAIKMLQEDNLDIHDPNFMSDPSNMKRLRYILQTKYPYLLVST